MDTINNKYLVFAFAAIVVLLLYFAGLNGRANENSWIGINSWLWFLTLVTIVFGIALSLLHFKKKI